MVNVNVRNSLIIYVFFAVTYMGYLLYDNKVQHNQWRKDFGEAKLAQLESYSPNAVLLGGSNVVYSLSAKLLNKETNLRWFNFGLSSEGFNDKNYWRYIEKSLSKTQREAVEIVIYSSLNFLRDGYIAERNNDKSDIWGNKKLTWIPNISIASRLRSYMSTKNRRSYPLPALYGDFNFDMIDCPFNYVDGFEREKDITQLNKWFFSQLDIMHNLFPNAILLFVIPSEYNGELYNLNQDQAMIANINRILDDHQNIRFDILVQPRYKNKSLTCDERQHANMAGRKWRTYNIINYINDIN